MSKYKSGDIAALFPHPKTPTTETGKKLQSLFNDFHQQNKSKFLGKNASPQQADVVKKNKKLFRPDAKFEREDKSGKKRKFSSLDSSLIVANKKAKNLKKGMFNEDMCQTSIKKTANETETKCMEVKSVSPEGIFFSRTEKTIKKKSKAHSTNQQNFKFSDQTISESSVSEFKLNTNANNILKNKHLNFIKRKQLGTPNNDSGKSYNKKIPYKKEDKKFEFSHLNSISTAANNKVKKLKRKKSDGDNFQTCTEKINDETERKVIKCTSVEEQYFPRSKKGIKKKLEVNSMNQDHKFSEQEISDLSMSEFKLNEDNNNMTGANHVNFIKRKMLGRPNNDIKKLSHEKFSSDKVNDKLYISHDDSVHKKMKSKKEKKAFKQKKLKSVENKNDLFNETSNDLNEQNFLKSQKQLKSKNRTAKFSVESTESNLEETGSTTSAENEGLKSRNDLQNRNKLPLKNFADNADKSEPNLVQKLFELKRKSNAEKYKDGKSLSLNRNNNFIKVPGIKCDASSPANHTLFVGNLPLTTSQKALEKLFSPFGVLESVRIRGVIPKKETIPKRLAAIKRQYHSGIHSLKGFVTFRDESCVSNALQLNGSYFQGHHIVVDRAQLPGQRNEYDNRKSIFIGNLPFDIDDESIWAAFSQCGPVEKVRIIRDRDTGVGKGFGYVLFSDIGSKENALSLEELEISGRKIRIKAIESKQNETQKGNSFTQYRSLKAHALKIKKKKAKGNSRKSVKKIMKKQKMIRQKKHISSLLQNKKSK